LIAINVFRTRKEHEKITDEQKKSFLPLLDLLELLKGTSNNPFFGFNGVFARDRGVGQGASFGGSPSDRFIGFAGGPGSSITVDGQTFLSRLLNPDFGKIFGGGTASAIQNFIATSSIIQSQLKRGLEATGLPQISPFLAAFQGFTDSKAFQNAISLGLVRAISSFTKTRQFTLDDEPFTARGFDFVPSGGQPPPGVGPNFANLGFATGRPSGGRPASVSPATQARDSRTAFNNSVFGLGGSGGLLREAAKKFAETLAPNARNFLLSQLAALQPLLDNAFLKSSARKTRRDLNTYKNIVGHLMRLAFDQSKVERLGFVKDFGRGETLGTFATFFGQKESEIFAGIQTKFDVIDLEARMFFTKREQLAMIG